MRRLGAFLTVAPAVLVGASVAEQRLGSHWPAQGRISSCLRRLTEKIEPRRDSIWINNIGND